MNLTVALIGLVIGTFIGISGVGGGSLMTPLLILFLRVHPVIAVGTDLVYNLPTKLVGSLVHARNQTVDRRLVQVLVAGGIPGAFAGLAIAAYARRHFSLASLDAIVRHAVGAALIVSAVALVIGIFARRGVRDGSQALDATTPAPALSWTRAKHIQIGLLGAFVGTVVSITSIGSGAITLPALYALLPRLGLRRIVGSDIAFATLLLLVAAVGNFLLGNVDFQLAGNLLIGSLPGVVLGSYLCRFLPENVLRPALAGILIFAGLRLV